MRDCMSEGVSDSLFYMWRTLFALAHADEVVTSEEVRFMAEALEDIAFSEEQRHILNDDIRYAQDIEDMFIKVTDLSDQAYFFELAREMVWKDGEYGEEEQAIMLKLQTIHVQDVNLDDLVGNVDLAFEEETSNTKKDSSKDQKSKSFFDKLLGH